METYTANKLVVEINNNMLTVRLVADKTGETNEMPHENSGNYVTGRNVVKESVKRTKRVAVEVVRSEDVNELIKTEFKTKSEKIRVLFATNKLTTQEIADIMGVRHLYVERVLKLK